MEKIIERNGKRYEVYAEPHIVKGFSFYKHIVTVYETSTETTIFCGKALAIEIDYVAELIIKEYEAYERKKARTSRRKKG